MKNALQALLGGTVIGTIFGYGLYLGITIPEVQISHSTGECVKVVNYREEHSYTCEDLPRKYNHVWVK